MDSSDTNVRKMDSEENILAGKAKEGDRDAFSELVSRYTDSMRAYVQSICYNATDAEDICQESLRKAYLNIGMYDPRYQFRTWLFSIARNAAIDHLRRKSTFTTVKLGETDEPVEEHEVEISPEESIVGEESYDAVMRTISFLPEKYRGVAELRLLHDYSYQEMADELGLPINTVRTRLRRARALIENMMKNER